MAKQKFSEKDIEQIMADPAVTTLSGWTEANADSACDEDAYRRKLSANHAGYMAKIKEALDSVTDTATTSY